MNQWIATHAKYTDKIASDPLKWEFSEWLNLDNYLRAHGLQLNLLTENLVDSIWYPKPSLPPPNLVFIHPLEYAGEPWENKIQSMKDFMSSKSVDVMVITALDQIAWLLNLRGKDNPFSPLFKAYFIISTSLCVLYLPKNKITPVLRNYLGDIVIKPYDLVWTDLPEFVRTGKCLYLPDEANFLLYAWVPPLKLLTGPSPVKDLKAYKNSAEAKGMRNSQIKDALVWVRLVHRIEKGVESGEFWDELKVLECIDQLRGEHWSYIGNSFPPTAAHGSHATDPEYRPDTKTNVKIGDDIMRVSFGSQYLDGTTKVNGILHCGIPTPLQRSVYTAILKGLIALVSTQFLPGSSLHRLEYLLEQPLLALALDYRPQRVHSIGEFLLVQEDFNSTLNINFFGVVEPEYLDCGIKIGQVIQVVPAYRERYMTMEVRSLFPFESRLIDTSQLESHEIRWINEFHATVRYVIGEQLVGRGLHPEYRTLIKKTDPLE
ncbi:hypothetical protein WDU94_005118 [Cyamophila willieti]